MKTSCLAKAKNEDNVTPSSHPLKNISESLDFAAMVPSQVYSSLQGVEEAGPLKCIRHLIIGGGAIDESLESKLRQFPNAVWSCTTALPTTFLV